MMLRNRSPLTAFRQVTVSIILLSVSICFSACKGRTVEQAEREGQRDVNAAQEEVKRREAEATKEVQQAGRDQGSVQDEKIEATEELAEAEAEVDDEKVAATEDLADAKEDSGQGGSFRRGDTGREADLAEGAAGE